MAAGGSRYEGCRVVQSTKKKSSEMPSCSHDQEKSPYDGKRELKEVRVIKQVKNVEDARKACLGPRAKNINLISSDGYQFNTKREHLMLSGVFRKILAEHDDFGNVEEMNILLKIVKGNILKTVCDYLAFKYYHTNVGGERPAFQISSEIAKEVFVAILDLEC